jgi:hypothetical protein
MEKPYRLQLLERIAREVKPKVWKEYNAFKEFTNEHLERLITFYAK